MSEDDVVLFFDEAWSGGSSDTWCIRRGHAEVTITTKHTHNAVAMDANPRVGE